MMVSAEAALVAAAAGLYLYDSALLLHGNEAILSPRRKRGWTVGFGFAQLGILGKEVYLPNPLLPHRPGYRLTWSYEGGNAGGPAWQPPEHGAFRLPAMLVWTMAVALFVFMPLGFFTRLGEPLLMASLATLFGSIIAALIWLWPRRTEFHLTRRRYASLAFESLVCPPFALNLVRHLASNLPVAENLIHAACRLQDAKDWEGTRARLAARVAAEMDGEVPESARFQALQVHRQMLTEGDSTCL
jgi:hypothetical protein